MDGQAADWVELLGLSDLFVRIEDADGVLRFASPALAEALATDPRLLEAEGPVRLGGSLCEVLRVELPSGGRAVVFRPLREDREELHARSRILAALVDGAPVAILVLDLDMRVTMWNPACERIFGWTEAEVLGEPYPLVPEDERTRFEGFFDTVIGGQGFTGVEAERERKDGRRIHIAISTAPIRDDDGEVLGAMAVLEDITERKLLEAHYAKAARLEAIGRLAGGVAHDFNNILTVILAYSESLDEHSDPAQVKSAAEAIRRSAERAAELTRQLLAFSRRQVLKTQVIELDEAVAESRDMLQRLIGTDISVRTDLSASAWVRVDPAQIERLLMNLAANARDAMPTGGTLWLSTRLVHRDGKPWVELAVRDTGEGMDEETASRVFEPFFTTKEAGKGTGLGLASVYGIVRQSGGEVDVDSTEGVGTTFRLRFPPAEAPMHVESAEQEAPPGDNPLTILVAEDDPTVREVILAMLRSLGHRTLVAEDGVQALAVAEAYAGDIDVLMTDVVMPRMGGGELAQKILAARPGIKVLFASGYTDDEVVRRGAERGGHFLQKPFTIRGIREALERLLDA